MSSLVVKDVVTLIGRLEATRGPDRQLDADIEMAAAYDPKKTGWAAPPFTGSLDAALTLIPDEWENRSVGMYPGWSEAILGLPGTREAYGRAKTPALAVCIAALKAITSEPASA
jgi:hypothetical protein